MADIVFNIVSGKMSGKVGGFSFETYCWSGGRGGSKKKGAAHPMIVNNPFVTTMKLKGHGDNDFAGPLPLGIYSLRAHESKENWIRLNPSKHNTMHKRDGFAIHGRGQRGSDGCIVPNDFSVVQNLYKELKQLNSKGTQVTLRVIAVGDLDYILNNMSTYSRTA